MRFAGTMDLTLGSSGQMFFAVPFWSYTLRAGGMACSKQPRTYC